MSVQSVSAKKEFAPSESKLFTLKRIVLATATVAAGALAAFSYFWGANEPDTDREISQVSTHPGSQLMPLVQDVALFVAGGLPSFAFLGVGAHVARGQQRLVRDMSKAFKNEFTLSLEFGLISRRSGAKSVQN
jgi:hypothetical protein